MDRPIIETPQGPVTRISAELVMRQMQDLFIAYAANIKNDETRSRCIQKFAELFHDLAIAGGGEALGGRETAIAGKIKQITKHVDGLRPLYGFVNKAASSINN